MDKITDKNKDRAIEILIRTFKTNPGALSVIKKDQYFEARLFEFCSFCINIAILKHGAYIASDQKGVALIFNRKEKVAIIPLLSIYLRLGSKCVGWGRAIPILWKQIIIQSKRPKIEYLHFWILAVEGDRSGLRTVFELRDFTYGLSKSMGVPIIAETRLIRNRNLYERYGFKCYNTWQPKSEENPVWFLIRHPSID